MTFFSAQAWADAGWRPPSPHQVLSFLMMMLTVATVIAIFIGPPWLVAALATLTGGSGYSATSSARMAMSPQIKEKLQRLDQKAFDAIDQEAKSP